MSDTATEARPVLVPGGNKAKPAGPIAQKPISKPLKTESEKKKDMKNPKKEPPVPLTTPRVVKKKNYSLSSTLSLSASCSSDASSDSSSSRPSTGGISSVGLTGGKKKVSGSEKKKAMGKTVKSEKVEKIEKTEVCDGAMDLIEGKRRCGWVTANSDPCYIAFHDEEWGSPVHDDRKLFELLVLSGALAELTWPVILSKRHIFREVFMDFDPVSVSKLNEKKIVAPGSSASSLLSEPKLRAIIENARQIVKITEEFGSFDRYIWNFMNQKPIVPRYRYARQVPVKTSKSELISKDMVKRGLRCVGPTVVYTFMQCAGLMNDHLITCFCFEDRAVIRSDPVDSGSGVQQKEGSKIDLNLSSGVSVS